MVLSGKFVLVVRGESSDWEPLHRGEDLKPFQMAGLPPKLLPGNWVSVPDYLLGLSLWLILPVFGGGLFIAFKLRGTSKGIKNMDDNTGASQNHEEFREQNLGLFRRLMIMMMVVDNHIHPDEISIIKDIYKKLTDREFPEEELPTSEEISFDETVEDVISKHKENLNRTEKEIILLSIFLVGAADKVIRREESDLLRNTAVLLGFSTGDMNEIHNGALGNQED